MADESADITQLLHEWREGNSAAENELFELVHPDLHRLAHFRLRGERKDHPMQTTELVNQAYLRLVHAKNQDWQNRQHFFAIAGRAMRRYLIDLARARHDVAIVALEDLEHSLPGSSGKVEFAITVGKLLDEMQQVNSLWCSVVELKFFLGMTDDEAADVLGVKLRSLQRMWHEARRWLFERMETRREQQDAI